MATQFRDFLQGGLSFAQRMNPFGALQNIGNTLGNTIASGRASGFTKDRLTSGQIDLNTDIPLFLGSEQPIAQDSFRNPVDPATGAPLSEPIAHFATPPQPPQPATPVETPNPAAVTAGQEAIERARTPLAFTDGGEGIDLGAQSLGLGGDTFGQAQQFDPLGTGEGFSLGDGTSDGTGQGGFLGSITNFLSDEGNRAAVNAGFGLANFGLGAYSSLRGLNLAQKNFDKQIEHQDEQLRISKQAYNNQVAAANRTSGRSTFKEV